MSTIQMSGGSISNLPPFPSHRTSVGNDSIDGGHKYRRATNSGRIRGWEEGRERRPDKLYMRIRVKDVDILLLSVGA